MFSYTNNKIIKRWNFNCSFNLENMMMQTVFPNIPIMPTTISRIPSIINLTLALKSSSSIVGWELDTFETIQLFEKFILILRRFQHKTLSLIYIRIFRIKLTVISKSLSMPKICCSIYIFNFVCSDINVFALFSMWNKNFNFHCLCQYSIYFRNQNINETIEHMCQIKFKMLYHTWKRNRMSLITENDI